MSQTSAALTTGLGIEIPLICGAMYPCSNPQLVAAVSAAGGIGVVQPLSLVYVHGNGFREGLRTIRGMTDRPVGVNALIEKSSRSYERRMREWVEIAIEEGIRFFVTSLGNPRWVTDLAASAGAKVYHDVTERKWALKACDCGVDGLIAVNERAGGHAGNLSAEQLLDELGDLGLPVVCAGGVATGAEFARVLRLGYAGVQSGTRFIATNECAVPLAYKQAILDASEEDIVRTEKLTGVPVAVIRTDYVRRVGTRAHPLARWMLRGGRTKRWMRALYGVQSLWRLKRMAHGAAGYSAYWQAGRSVGGIDHILPAGDVVREFAAAWRADLQERQAGSGP
jgi:nitronate monooxygenase